MAIFKGESEGRGARREGIFTLQSPHLSAVSEYLNASTPLLFGHVFGSLKRNFVKRETKSTGHLKLFAGIEFPIQSLETYLNFSSGEPDAVISVAIMNS